MRVLLVNRSARPHTGGANRVVVETTNLLKQAGHTVALAYWQDEEPAVNCECLRVSGQGTTPGEDLFSRVEAFRPDVVQFHFMDNPELEGRITNHWPSCRFVHDQGWYCSGGDRMARGFEPCHKSHGLACLGWHYAQGCGGLNPAGNLARWRRVEERRHLNQQSSLRFQVASEFMRRGLVENQLPLERIDLVPLFAIAPDQICDGVANQLLVASRLVRGKGVDLLLRSLAMLRNQDWQLVIAGDGPQRAELESLAGSLNLMNRTEFTGEIAPEQLAKYYGRCSVVVSPTLRPEPFGLVGPEAMAYGRAVVAFDGGATPEWLTDGETGILVSERSPEALAAAVSRLLSDAAMCRRLGDNARKAWNRFSPARYVDLLCRSFERTIEKFGERPAT